MIMCCGGRNSGRGKTRPARRGKLVYHRAYLQNSLHCILYLYRFLTEGGEVHFCKPYS